MLKKYCSSIITNVFKFIGTPYDEQTRLKRNLLKGIALLVTRGIQTIILWSFLMIIYLVKRNQWDFRAYLLGIWCSLEVVFYISMRLRHNSLNKKCNYITKSPEELEELVQTVLDNVVELEEYLGRWLINKPDPLHAEHCREWLTWAFFNKNIVDLNEEEELQAERIMDIFRDKFSNRSEPHLIQPQACIRPTLDTGKVKFKPLIFYALMGVPKILGRLMLFQFGFQKHSLTESGFYYWNYTPPQIDNQIPILFIHGIGIGLVMYANLITRIHQKYPNRRIFLLEVPYVSLDPQAQVFYFTETLLAIDEMCQLNNIKQASVIGHSFGTVIVAWLVNNRPSLLNQVTFIDPICFNIWEASLAIYTLYSSPFSFLHEMCRFFFVQDPVINHAISRSFQWSQNIIFVSKLKINARIFYSEYDYVLNAPALFKNLQTHRESQSKPNFDVVIHPVTHGGYLFESHLIDLIVSDL